MPTIETLILRRSHPVPVTFADLRRAAMSACPFPPFWIGPWSSMYKSECKRPEHSCHALIADVRQWWSSAIKEATGATDDIYALIDGHEVRVATVTGSGESATANLFGCISAGQAASVLIAADEAGYWERPHEVRVVLQERPVSVAAIERAVNVGWTSGCGGSA